MPLVLIALADSEALNALTFAFRREDFEVATAQNGATALHIWWTSNPELVVLDTDLPAVSGYEVCRIIHMEAANAVILLGRDGSDAAVVRGLEQGADLYVTVPFSMAQLIARAKALLRRVRLQGHSPGDRKEPSA
jgi:DNA-binding response OmpR family regulator